MRRLIFASNNKHKVVEVRAALAGIAEVVSLSEAGLEGDIPETADTLQGNALQKAQWVWERIKNEELRIKNLAAAAEFDGCFADDTGLEVEALGGAPGVFSARYADLEGFRDLKAADVPHTCSFDDNINKLLAALDGETNRKADFRTVICLISLTPNPSPKERGTDSIGLHPPSSLGEGSGVRPIFFEGRVDGQILTERHTNGEGFGYDPIFMPDRFAVSFAEMPLEVKNSISHRGLALKKVAEYLSNKVAESQPLSNTVTQ